MKKSKIPNPGTEYSSFFATHVHALRKSEDAVPIVDAALRHVTHALLVSPEAAAASQKGDNSRVRQVENRKANLEVAAAAVLVHAASCKNSACPVRHAPHATTTRTLPIHHHHATRL